MKKNIDGKMLWGAEELPDIEATFQSSLEYASTPGWGVIHRKVLELYDGFNGLQSIEMGCGHGKMSLLFSLLGTGTTLLDYSKKQLVAAEYIHKYFEQESKFIESDILRLPADMLGKYDISFSFGTAEHFWDDERQAIFNSHAKVLKKGGISIICVPNKWGMLFHLGRGVRAKLKRNKTQIDETSFTRKELYYRAQNAGLKSIEIFGSDRLIVDFHNFILKMPFVDTGGHMPLPQHIDHAKNMLIDRASTNTSRISFVNNLFCYALILIGRKP